MNQEPTRIHSGAETSLTDGDIAAIVQQAQNGEAAAFGQLYEIYSDRVFRYVAYRVDSDADAGGHHGGRFHSHVGSNRIIQMEECAVLGVADAHRAQPRY